MKDLRKVQEFFSRPLEEINETKFSKPTGLPYEQKDLYAQELFGIEYFNWLEFWEQFHIVQKYKLDRSIITKEGKENEVKEKLTIKVAPEDKARAFEIYRTGGYENISKDDRTHIVRYGSKFGSDVYASNSIEDIYDFLDDLKNKNIKIEYTNVDDIDYDVPMRETQHIQDGMEGTLDEPYWIEVTTIGNNELKALEIFKNEFSNTQITFYPGNVYASYEFGDMYDLFHDFKANDIEFYSGYDFDSGPEDDDIEDYRLDEDAFEDTWKLNQRKAQSFIDKYPDDVNIGYAKAYLKIDDVVKANKYWNDYNLKDITRGVEYLTSMESLKEIVKATLEEKKKRDRCLKIADRKFDKPSAYKSAAAVRCRQGEIWKGLKEELIKEKAKETLRTWFSRQGAPGKTGGWVDCNSPIYKDGKKKGYKPCGRAKGEKRAKYPSCRPTAAKCNDPGKGKSWGKTK
jgi:hypothetical protein